MGAAGRRHKLLERLKGLEGEYENLLVSELEHCAKESLARERRLALRTLRQSPAFTGV
jgi:hypothetical protein